MNLTQKEKADRFDGLCLALKLIADDLDSRAKEESKHIGAKNDLNTFGAFLYGRAQVYREISDRIRGMLG